MTALKKTVRTRRGVEPTGRPARREVEQGRRATNDRSEHGGRVKTTGGESIIWCATVFAAPVVVTKR